MKSDRGVISGMTKKLGMREVLKIVLNYTSGLEEESLLRAMVRSGKGLKERGFSEILKSSKPRNRELELKKILSTVNYARQEIYDLTAQWLLENIPMDVNEIIIGGGTAYYYRNALKNLLKRYRGVNVTWSAGLEKQVSEVFGLPSLDAASRVTDAYSLFMWMQNQLYPKLKLVTTQR